MLPAPSRSMRASANTLRGIVPGNGPACRSKAALDMLKLLLLGVPLGFVGQGSGMAAQARGTEGEALLLGVVFVGLHLMEATAALRTKGHFLAIFQGKSADDATRPAGAFGEQERADRRLGNGRVVEAAAGAKDLIAVREYVKPAEHRNAVNERRRALRDEQDRQRLGPLAGLEQAKGEFLQAGPAVEDGRPQPIASTGALPLKDCTHEQLLGIVIMDEYNEPS